MSHAVDDSGDPVLPWPPIEAPAAGELRFDPLYGDLHLDLSIGALAKRTRYLANEVNLTGVLKVFPVADVPALRALTGIQPGDTVRVGRQGLYVFTDDAGVGVDAAPWVYRSVPQGGSWYHENFGTPLDRQIIDAIGDTAVAGNTILATLSTTAYQVADAVNTRVVLTCMPIGSVFRAGSSVLIDLVTRMGVQIPGVGGSTRLTLTEWSIGSLAKTSIVPGSERVMPASPTTLTLVQQRLVGKLAGGTAAVNLDLEVRSLPTPSPSATVIFKPLMMRAMVLRP
ncbi:MAG TPA: hypothetical protein VF316_16590 [Polyangiaceae bacterium]